MLYVPEFHFNLISISKLCDALDCIDNFNGSQCFIQVRNTEKMIGFGERREELYYLTLSDKVACNSSKAICHTLILDLKILVQISLLSLIPFSIHYIFTLQFSTVPQLHVFTTAVCNSIAYKAVQSVFLALQVV